MLFENISRMWLQAISDVKNSGRRLDSRDGGCAEIIGWSGMLANIDKNVVRIPERRFDPMYACAEFLWYLSGKASPDFLMNYAPSYARFLDEGIAKGAYGPHWARQLPDIIHILSKNPESRQAVITTFSELDLCDARLKRSKDIPCTVSLQFLMRKSSDGIYKLHVVANMRSNDLWLGMPYDIFCFTSLQRLVAASLSKSGVAVQPGTYTHNVGSLHIYDRNAERCALALEQLSCVDICKGHEVSKESTLVPELEVRELIKTIGTPGTKADSWLGYGDIISDMAVVCHSKYQPDAAMFVKSPDLYATLQTKLTYKEGRR